MLSYPINIDVKGRLCVVIGGGETALRKIQGLLEAGAVIYLIATEVCDTLQRLIDEHKVFWAQTEYKHGCIPQGVLCVVATDDWRINKWAAKEADRKDMLVNVVTGSSMGEKYRWGFDNPSTIRRGDLMLTISTGGRAPALSKLIRQKLETIFNEDFGRKVEVLGSMRDEVKRTIDDPGERINFWRDIMTDEIFSPTVDSEELGVKIRNALNSYRAQSHHRTD